ncbi:DUF1446-domain-containing protein [Aspergillus terreus]|uniref:DUF1446-domain-containing protein n=1 Tax=Aspergillus terreus TaxID=33178 RepID=A0A5M3YR63_ASPTE|nr:hypothetical protein ATETN484_0002037200 [Aspergillus terreus]GFF15228.1 DUF1446-domain-containing protein [Aspergillus terreus]
MYRQATLGDVDFITGDYLAEVNMANNSEAWRAGKHPGYEETAWAGIEQTIDVIAQKGIRVVINGGALDPKALAEKVDALVTEKNLNVRVAYLSGDDLYPEVGPDMPTTKEKLQHLDSDNPSVVKSDLTFAFLHATDNRPVPMVSAHAYLGARGIVRGLKEGAQIIICGRVADASPVIAAAWYWYDWDETDYDKLAGALVAGHLVECSAYVTGGNFSGFDRYPLENLVEPGFPIAEVEDDGSCIITKHPNTQGMVNADTVRCQFLYELQGSIYLNSDVSARVDNIVVEEVGKDRVRVSGITGSPPPPTTKLAVFYQGGYEAELLLNATGYATSKKWDLIEKQLRHFIPNDVLDDLETLEFQRVGVPAPNPGSQLESTTYLRIFIASRSARSVGAVSMAMRDISLKHFSGFHCTLDMRTAVPRPFLAYYPALVDQGDIKETIHLIDGAKTTSIEVPRPSKYEALAPRENYDPTNVSWLNDEQLTEVRLGDVALARSGDKGANLNFGIFVPDPQHWEWLRCYMTVERMRQLTGKDWDESFYIERVEFPRIHAVHFVIYGVLGRGVSSSSRLDGLGKGFADYIRDKIVEIPARLWRC